MFLVRFLLYNGVGQNLTAGIIGLAIGWLWARAKLQTLHARHDQHREHLATVGRSLADLHEKLDRLEDTGFQGRANLGQVKPDAPAASRAKPKRPRAPRAPKP